MQIQSIIEEVNSTIGETNIKIREVKSFISKYSAMDTDDIDWTEVCSFAKEIRYYKYGFVLITKLLSYGLYRGSHSELLYRNLPIYESIITGNAFPSLPMIMCGDDIDKQVIYANNMQKCYSVTQINTENTFLVSLFRKFANEKNTFASSAFPTKVVNAFGKSLGKYESEIETVYDFSDRTFFAQIKYYRQRFEKKGKTSGIRLVIEFYRWLVRSNPEHSYFENSIHMSDRMLFNAKFSDLMNRGFYITTVNPENIPYGKTRICFLLKGIGNESSRITNDDYVTIDFSGLTCDFYRDLLIEFVMLSGATSITYGNTIVSYVYNVLQKLYLMKDTVPGYPNKSLTHLTTQEAVFIRRFFDSQNVGIYSKNNRINFTRRFISYCVDRKKITVDNLFFDYLSKFASPNKNQAQSISDDELVQINKCLIDKSKDDIFYKEMLVIFHLAIQTEFRISQICNLTIDCIRPTVKPNQFEVVSVSKTSNGSVERFTISALTYNLLMDIIEETESIRESCYIESLKQYIFVYQQKRKENRPVIFNQTIFSNHFRKLCESIGIHKYSAANLRDTHMTKALEHIMRSGKSDAEMAVLSRHRHLDTTKNHYIEMELEKMLESTYGIIIGEELVSTDSKIVDDIPDNLQGKESDVENGCGKCTAESCVITSPLPCLACKHFVTTVRHEVFFQKAIENIDRLISLSGSNRHDKEDLVTIKQLYVLYLKAILKKKEGVDDND